MEDLEKSECGRMVSQNPLSRMSKKLLALVIYVQCQAQSRMCQWGSRGADIGEKAVHTNAPRTATTV
jgi:hypothetical protein